TAPSGTVTLTNIPGAASPGAVTVPITGTNGSITVSQPATGATLNIGNTNAVAGGQVKVPVTLTTNGASIAALSMDIGFDTTKFSLPGGNAPTAAVIDAAGIAASKSIEQSSPTPGVLRVGVFDRNGAQAIGDGVVFTVTFNVLPTAPSGTVTLTNIPGAASPAAVRVPITGAAGSITVSGSQSDVQKPVVTYFTIPATATSPTITFTAFTATDNIAVTGYIITESSTAPAAGAIGWTSNKPTSYTFTAVPEFVPTAKTLYAWARDFAGNVSNVFTPADIILTLPDLTPPAITNLSMLADGAVTNVPVQNITGTAIDASTPPVTVTVNGTSTPVNAATGAFNTSVTLANGANAVTIRATDSAAALNTTTVVRNITLDTTKPGFASILPADNSLTKNLFLTVSGTIDDPTATVTVAVNSGTPVTAALTGTSFTSQVTLTAGVNTIDLMVTDPASNVTSAKRTVTSDPTAPTLAITSPPQDASTAEATMIIGGTVTDNRDTIETVTVSVDGQAITPATAVTAGSFSQLITMPTLKTYVVTVSAMDLAGNKPKEVQRNITRRLPNGALNGSAEPSLADALKVLNVTVGLETLSASEKVNADVAPLVNGKPVSDGTVDVGDALVILKRVIGLLTW
ncbi:MAG: beta strand repeat-containing protein, partial [Desulfuromonadaceae bacterium]